MICNVKLSVANFTNPTAKKGWQRTRLYACFHCSAWRWVTSHGNVSRSKLIEKYGTCASVMAAG